MKPPPYVSRIVRVHGNIAPLPLYDLGMGEICLFNKADNKLYRNDGPPVRIPGLIQFNHIDLRLIVVGDNVWVAAIKQDKGVCIYYNGTLMINTFGNACTAVGFCESASGNASDTCMWYNTYEGDRMVIQWCELSLPPQIKHIVVHVHKPVNVLYSDMYIYVRNSDGDKYTYCRNTGTVENTPSCFPARYNGEICIITEPDGSKTIGLYKTIVVDGKYVQSLSKIAPLSEYPNLISIFPTDCEIVVVNSTTEIPDWNPQRKILSIKNAPFSSYVAHCGVFRFYRVDINKDYCDIIYYKYKWSWDIAALQSREIKERILFYIIVLKRLGVPRYIVEFIVELALNPY